MCLGFVMNTGINQNPMFREKRATSIKKVSPPLKKNSNTHCVRKEYFISSDVGVTMHHLT